MGLKAGFFSGVAAGGAFGSAFGGKVGKWLQKARDFPKFIGTTLAGGISGGVGSRLAGGKFWDGFRNGAIAAGLNHGLHSLQQRISEYFESKKAAYDYAVEESTLLELENGYTIEREVSGFALENGDYVVQDPTNNTRTRSYNEIIVKGGKNYVRHNGKLYQIKSQFHTHPSGMNYTEGVGVSRADLRLMNNTLSGAPMSILYRGNEWIVSQGNQFSKYGYSYSLTNNGSWK
jgi:hypothetical protein